MLVLGCISLWPYPSRSSPGSALIPVRASDFYVAAAAPPEHWAAASVESRLPRGVAACLIMGFT